MFDTGPQPTRATPAGCLVGLLALASFIFSGIGIWGLIVAWNTPDKNRPEDLVTTLILIAIFGSLFGIILLWLGWKMALSAHMKDPDDRKKPMVRF